MKKILVILAGLLLTVQIRAQYDARQYFSLTASEGDVTIGWKKVGSPADYTIQWSEDGINWSQSETLSGSKTLVTIPDGETCYFRHGAAEAIARISSNQNNHWSFTMSSASGSASVQAGGNIMSLLDMTCQKNSLAGSPQHVFTGLFKGCDLLTVAPELPFGEISQFCYMNMFEGSGITSAPQLPATSVKDGAYMGMFKGCKNLENVPLLPGRVLSRRAYEEMFYGCDKLTRVEIVAITTVSQDVAGVFVRWLEGTATGTEGRLISSFDMLFNTGIPAGCIPSNWHWASEIDAHGDPDSPGNFYTTFYDSRSAYVIPEGVKAYTARSEEIQGATLIRLVRVPDGIIPSGTAVLLHSPSARIPMTSSGSDAPTIDGNEFMGTDVAKAQTDGYSHYMFSCGREGLGFYKMKSGTLLMANKAYLCLAGKLEGDVNVVDNQEGSDSEYEFGTDE